MHACIHTYIRTCISALRDTAKLSLLSQTSSDGDFQLMPGFCLGIIGFRDYRF